jgi:tRNA-dihydrouridine synthase B
MKYPIKVKSPVFLAPMAGVTNVAFRILCKRLGAGMCYTEFLSADALARYKDLIEKDVGFDVVKEERPVVTQIFGEDEKNILQAGEFIEKKTDIIDLNIGCPAPKIMACGGGSAMLKNPKKIESVLETLTTLSVPISCKIRLGINNNNIVALKVAKIAERVGCCAIAVHPRTQRQGYSGSADWSYIKKVKESVGIPVIGNGDVNTPSDVQRMIDETGCDYVMVGRAAMKDPFFFKRANYYLKYGEVMEQVSFDEKMKLLDEYVALMEKYNIITDFLVKQAVMQFTKGYDGGKTLRNKVSRLKSREEILREVESFSK